MTHLQLLMVHACQVWGVGGVQIVYGRQVYPQAIQHSYLQLHSQLLIAFHYDSRMYGEHMIILVRQNLLCSNVRPVYTPNQGSSQYMQYCYLLHIVQEATFHQNGYHLCRCCGNVIWIRRKMRTLMQQFYFASSSYGMVLTIISQLVSYISFDTTKMEDIDATLCTASSSYYVIT